MATSREVLFHADLVYRVQLINTESSCTILEFKNSAFLSDSKKKIIAAITGKVSL